MTENNAWPSLADLLTADRPAGIALLGAPLAGGSVTPGRCDLAPGAVRNILRRIGTYDVETGGDLAAMGIHDAGDLALNGLSPAEAFEPVRDAAARLIADYPLTVILGGNNAVTRPGAHALDPSLKSVGLLTLDAHFDMRETASGLINGNPVQALIDDGLSGAQIAQIGLAPFANAAYMHEIARAEGISVYTMADCRRRGIKAIVDEALRILSERCDVIYADFDIDVIDRAQCPGAPGARPGGMAASDFFAAARLVAAHPKVRAVDLTEFDPPLDVADVTALTAGRWLAEIVSGARMKSGAI